MRHWFLTFGLIAASAAQATVHVSDVALTPNVHGYRLRIQASGDTRYTLHMYPEPARLIVDIPKAILDLNSRVTPVASGDGPVLRFSQFTRNPDSVRVVVNLPHGASTWRESSSSPASEIVIEIPTAMGQHVQPASSHITRSRTAHRPEAEPTQLDASEHPRLPEQLSARELERRQIEAGVELRHRMYGPPEPVGPPAPVEPLPEPASIARQTSHGRSRLASRGGRPDTTDLMVDPAAAPAPSWDPEEAVALIKDGPCPETLRSRLIEVVSNRAIQTSRYVWGAQTPGQFDCSGLALYIYDAIGVKLPRCSWQQCEVGEAVDRDGLRAGDLVFFDIKGAGVSHVGIYLGDGRFLHAANPKSNLKITSLDTPFYAARFAGARRVYEAKSSDTDSLGG